MTTTTAAQAIFQKLCDKFKRDGKDDWENVYTLGEELGYSKDEAREALRDFEKTDQWQVENRPRHNRACQVVNAGKDGMQVTTAPNPALSHEISFLTQLTDSPRLSHAFHKAKQPAPIIAHHPRPGLQHQAAVVLSFSLGHTATVNHVNGILKRG